MPTIKDVARECGVSANTVSCVLNNKPGEVSARTRERILDAIRRLGYRPNAAARHMVGKRTNTIGIADRYTDSAYINPYKTQILESLVQTARRNRLDVLYYSGHPSEEQVSNFPAYLDGRCDGLICYTGGIDQEEANAILQTGLPVVFVGETPFAQDGAVIDVDNEAGAYLAVTHLTELGHTRIAMMPGNGTSGNVERIAGYRRALAERNIAFDSAYLYSTYAWEDVAYEQGLHALALPERPTAVFCYNDPIAFGLLRAARELGIRVPEQLSIVGFDDIPPAAMTTPPLTTVRQPLSLIGQRAVEILIGVIEGNLPRNHREITPPDLILRSSTAVASR
ncbi:MAG: LacI family DNA-binding transcriptional regulator [Fibrella sp.]|nr:LacI family DNA-binding transcriptional regulator [Armatimonadota bacterium]